MAIYKPTQTNGVDPRISEALNLILKNKQDAEVQMPDIANLGRLSIQQPEYKSNVITPEEQKQQVNAFKRTPLLKMPVVPVTANPAPTGEFTNVDANNTQQGKQKYWDNQGSNIPASEQVVESNVQNPAVSHVTPEFLKNQWDTLKSPEARRRVQEKLKAKGLYKGKIDGGWGELTKGALLNEYKQSGLQPENTQDELMSLIDNNNKVPSKQEEFNKLTPEQQDYVNAQLQKEGKPIYTKTGTSSSSKTSTTGTITETPQEYFEKTGMNPLFQYMESLKPKKDVATEQRLKQIAQANAIGDALRVVSEGMNGDKGSYGSSITEHKSRAVDENLKELRMRELKFDSDSDKFAVRKLQQAMAGRNEWVRNKQHKEIMESQSNIAAMKMANDNKNKDLDRKNKTKGDYIAANAKSGSGGNKKVIQVYDYPNNKNYTLTDAQKNEILNRAIKRNISEIADQFKLYDENGKPNETIIRQALFNDPTGKMFDVIAQKYWNVDFEPDGNGGIKPKDNSNSKSIYNTNYYHKTVTAAVNNKNLTKDSAVAMIAKNILDHGINGNMPEDIDEALKLADDLYNRIKK